MSWEFKPAADLAPGAWDEFVRQREGTLFQTRQWIALYVEAGFRDDSFAALRDGQCAGVFPLVTVGAGPFRKAFSVPLSQAGGYLGEVPPEALLIRALRARADSIQIQSLAKAPPDFAWSPVLGVRLDLSASEDALLKGLSKTLRYEIRKAPENPALRVVEASEERHLADAWQLYEKTMARNSSGGSYWPGLLRGIHRLPAELRKFTLAYSGETPIALNVFVRFGKHAHYFAAASDHEFHSLLANPLLQWQAILWAKRSGSETVHFGGGLSPQEKDSLFQYKKKWGTETETWRAQSALGWKGRVLDGLDRLLSDDRKRRLKRFVLAGSGRS
jgi:CelD/BcsL family acetyltransferase involved in cellulose biosynthesis